MATLLPPPPEACSLTDDAFELLQKCTARAFDLVVVNLDVSPRVATSTFSCADFLACTSLVGMHLALVLPPMTAPRAVKHFLDLCQDGKGPLSTVLLTSPGAPPALTEL